MALHISWKKKLEPTGWSLAFCSHCQQLEAMRVEQVVQVVAIWFIPVSGTVEGFVQRCDFCERISELPPPGEGLELDAWRPAEGLDALATRLRGPSGKLAKDIYAETRLRSALSSIRESMAFNQLDVTWGIVLGGALGLGLGIGLGVLVYDLGLNPTRADRFGVGMLGGMLMAVAGAVLGAAGWAFVSRRRIAKSRIRRLCREYRLDAARVASLAEDYGEILHRAATDERDFGNFA
jgi:hypothetical protein